MISIDYPPVWIRAWRWIKSLFDRRSRVGNFESFIFPVIKNIQYQPLIEDIIPLQPLQQPSGTTFYMDFKYGVGKTPWRKRIKKWIFGERVGGCCRPRD